MPPRVRSPRPFCPCLIIAKNSGNFLPVDEVLGVDELELVEELDGQHQHRLQRELATADVEQVLQ